jgi:hypothetical protein
MSVVRRNPLPISRLRTAIAAFLNTSGFRNSIRRRSRPALSQNSIAVSRVASLNILAAYAKFLAILINNLQMNHPSSC